MLNRWKCWTVELKTETLTKFEIETWAWVEREKQIHTQYVCRRLCDFIHITHMTLCNIKLSSFSLQQINAYTICLNIQQPTRTDNVLEYFQCYVCVHLYTGDFNETFIRHSVLSNCCVHQNWFDERGNVCVCVCICEKIYQMPMYCKSLQVHSITNEQLKKEKNSKTKIGFFLVKKMMKMKYIPLIHTLFNAVDSNLYCVFYENHTSTSLSELWCVYVRTIHMNEPI